MRESKNGKEGWGGWWAAGERPLGSSSLLSMPRDARVPRHRKQKYARGTSEEAIKPSEHVKKNGKGLANCER